MIMRPYGLVMDGRLEVGLELVLEEGRIQEIRPHTGLPDPFVLSPAFVNAHSHLEYRGLMGKLNADSYWPWIREVTRLKAQQDLDQVATDAAIAAHENRRAGVGWILEHSDRPVARDAIRTAGLPGAILQEVITFLEADDPSEKLAAVRERAEQQGALAMTPHAFHTVDGGTLEMLGRSDAPLSIHVAETPAESEMTVTGSGVIAEFYQTYGKKPVVTGKSVLKSLVDLGVVRRGAQLVHCCDLDEEDLEVLAASDATVAHCPRSNEALRCPIAPVREMLDRRIPVGLGLDSAASSGPIDMFAEMRAALRLAEERGRPIHAVEAWQMATSAGAASIAALGGPDGPWDIEVGSRVPLIGIHVRNAMSTEDLIAEGAPERVEWV